MNAHVLYNVLDLLDMLPDIQSVGLSLLQSCCKLWWRLLGLYTRALQLRQWDNKMGPLAMPPVKEILACLVGT